MLGIGNQTIINGKWQSNIVLFYQKLLRARDVAYEKCTYFMYLFIEISNCDMRDVDEWLDFKIFLDVVNRNSHFGWFDKLRQF